MNKATDSIERQSAGDGCEADIPCRYLLGQVLNDMWEKQCKHWEKQSVIPSVLFKNTDVWLHELKSGNINLSITSKSPLAASQLRVIYDILNNDPEKYAVCQIEETLH